MKENRIQELCKVRGIPLYKSIVHLEKSPYYCFPEDALKAIKEAERNKADEIAREIEDGARIIDNMEFRRLKQKLRKWIKKG